jgi:hypothetical protein
MGAEVHDTLLNIMTNPEIAAFLRDAANCRTKRIEAKYREEDRREFYAGVLVLVWLPVAVLIFLAM